MSSASFRFRQFEVFHDRCAMKVGTDGVLLGAWAGQSLSEPSLSASSLSGQFLSKTFAYTDSSEQVKQSAQSENSFPILDIGTGSGLVALMLAQRFPDAQITALDIEPSAVEQAQFNFAHSPWPDRLSAVLSSLQSFRHSAGFRLIVSNPPYFQHSLKNPDKSRELARHTDSLSYSDLVAHTARLLAVGGLGCYILPAEAESEMLALLRAHSLCPLRIMQVHSKPGKPAKRILLEFTTFSLSISVQNSLNSRTTPEPTRSIFYIESLSSPRSPEYASLTRDFYL